MRITKCDICKKTITRGSESLQLMGSGGDISYMSLELCSACSKPIVKILKNKKLIKSENKKNGGK
jgi:hypothetical protein